VNPPFENSFRLSSNGGAGAISAAASFASLGDVIIAEPGAMMGFAGPRVIRNTIKTELPEGFQTAEFMLEHRRQRTGVRRFVVDLRGHHHPMLHVHRQLAVIIMQDVIDVPHRIIRRQGAPQPLRPPHDPIPRHLRLTKPPHSGSLPWTAPSGHPRS